MKFHGIQWNFRKFKVIACHSVVFHGFLLDFPCNSMASHCMPCISVKFQALCGNCMRFCGMPLNFMESHLVWWIFIHTYQISWHPMESHGSQWNAMEFHLIGWDSVELDRICWRIFEKFGQIVENCGSLQETNWEKWLWKMSNIVEQWKCNLKCTTNRQKKKK